MSGIIPVLPGHPAREPGKSVSCCLSGSMSTEAALVFPLFYLACVLLALILEMTAVDLRVRSGVAAAAREMMISQTEHPSLSVGEMEDTVAREAGFDGLDTHLLSGGAGGVSLAGSSIDPVSGIGIVRWQYHLRLPFPVFGAEGGEHKGFVRVKAWNGYHGDDGAGEQEEVVYVTPYGIVYHTDPGCTHLSLTIAAVSAAAVGECRNQNGGRYYPCARCARMFQGYQTVYIAREGDRFHTDRRCSGLKRSIEAIPLSEAGGRRPCSRCSR